MVKSSISSMHANTSVATIDSIPPAISTPSLPSSTSSISKPNKASKPKRSTRQILSKATSTIARPFKKPPPTFTVFPDLPTEIRLKIWEHTIEPRVHELHPCANLYHNRMTFRSNASTTPAIFHASTESREVAQKHYQLMEYTPNSRENEDGTSNGKGILRFYFAPKYDTLLLNSLMGLFVMFMLLEEGNSPENILSTGGPTTGVMKGWERVAIDAERAQLITLLSGVSGHSPQPKFKKLLPNLKELVIAFDYTKNGKTRFRTSVWPGENGTTLVEMGVPRGLEGEWAGMLDGCLRPLRGFLKRDYAIAEEKDDNGNDGEEVDKAHRRSTHKNPNIPTISTAKVMRKRYVRGDLRYAFRWSCSLIGVRPRGVFRRL